MIYMWPILFFGWVGVSSYVIYNLLRKLEIFEDYTDSVLEKLRDILGTIRAVDLRGSFESDDEVGDVFRAIKSTIEELEQFIEFPTQE